MKTNQMVYAQLRNTVVFGSVIKTDGCNVYIDSDGTIFKFHQDDVRPIDNNKYYIIEEKQTPQGIEIRYVSAMTRSTRKLGYKLINELGLPRLEAFHKQEEGLMYAGQWYYNCRKGSTILK